MTTGSRCEEAKWTLRLFYSLFSVPQPIAYVRQLIARVTVAIMITPRKLCGFRGEKKNIAQFPLWNIWIRRFWKKKKKTHTHTQNATIFLAMSLQTLARRIKGIQRLPKKDSPVQWKY